MASALLAPAVAEPLLWLAPSPMWDDSGIPGDQPALARPTIVELATDDFVPTFLRIMAGDDAIAPNDIATLVPHDGTGTFDDPVVLYRPMHQRYYFVVGSLVCRRIGLPDRSIDPRGQRVSFVVRRVGASGEQAWVPDTGAWVAVSNPDRLVDGEEQHPMHTAPVAAPAASGPAASLLGLDVPGRRTVHFGYIPVGGQSAKPTVIADPVAALASDPDRSIADDPRVMEFRLRVAGAWSDVGAKSASGVDITEPSLYVLLDLRDWLQKYLPAVLTALVGGTALPLGTPREALRQQLDIFVQVDDNGDNVFEPRALGTVLGELAAFLPLLSGAAIDEPATKYRIDTPPGGLPTYVNLLGGTGSAFAGLIGPALDDPAAPGTPQTVPAELAHAIIARPDDPAEFSDRHVLRLVYEHDPCKPVVSAPTPVARFAGVYDPDAPARPIRIELPDPEHLRRFSRGVAIEMPPSLRRMLDSITPKILKEEKPGPEGDWGLGMICSFSLQIIMLVAFIVMFIFLILLNIVFWWLPFLKICFPVPKKRSASP